MSEIRSTPAARTQKPSATPAKTSAPKVQAESQTTPKSEQLGQVASRFSDDKAVGLSEFPQLKKKPEQKTLARAKPKVSQEDLDGDKRSGFLGQNERFHTLKAAEQQLDKIRDGSHQKLNTETEAIQKEYDENIQRLRDGRRGERESIRNLRDEAQTKLRTVRRQVSTNYKEERREISRLSRDFSAESKSLKAADPDAAKIAFSGTRAEYDLSDKTRSDKSVAFHQKKRDRANAKLKEQYGFELPSSGEMATYRKDGPPTGDSLKDKVHRLAFARKRRQEIRSSIPKTEEDRQSHLEATKEQTKTKLDKLDERSDRVEPTYKKYADEYKATRDKKLDKAKSARVKELNDRVKANQTYSISELPKRLQDSVAAQDVPKDAEARLVGDTLVYQRKDGQEVKVEPYPNGGTLVTTSNEHVNTRTVLHKSGEEASVTTAKDRYSGREVVKNYNNDGKGQEVHSQVAKSGKIEERSEQKLQDGKEVSSSRSRRVDGRITLKEESETVIQSDGASRIETTTEYPQEDRKIVGNESRNADGKVTGRTKVETQRTKSGSRSNTQILLDPASGRTRETENSLTHNKGSRTETTSVYEGKANDRGEMVSKKQTSKVQETVTDARYATSDEKDLPGLGWSPWDNPQDLMNDMEDHGGPVKTQNITRQVTGADGKTHTEKVTKFFNGSNEVQLTQGPDGKNVWTHRVKDEKTGNWDSQVFFQGSSEDSIKSEHSQEGRYSVQTTKLRMEDHPGMEKNKVPKSSTAVVKTAEGMRMGEVDRVAQEMGFSKDELQNMDALKVFKDKFGSADDLKIEIKTNDDKFYSSSKNKKGSTVIVTGPDGSKLVLSRDQLKDKGGIRAEWKNKEGQLTAQESLTDGDKIYEQEARPTDDKGKEAALSQGVRSTFKHTEYMVKVANRGFRASGRISGAAMKKIAPGLDAISGGLGVISTAHDFANEEYGRGIVNAGGAATDFGMMIRAAQQVKDANLGRGFGTGASGVMKKFGVAGAAIGVFSGAGKIIDGDGVGGGLDIGASAFAGAAIYGIPGVGWVAGGLALGSAIWDYRNDTVIAEPQLTRD